MNLTDRFWPKVDLPDANGCWLWTGARNRRGYGRLSRGGRDRGVAYAHRVSYELFIGPIPDGFQIDHLCRNPSCVNPSHLEAVSQRENLLRGRGWPGQNARKTECLNGHPFDEENTRLRPLGRNCRACDRDRRRGSRERTRSTA